MLASSRIVFGREFKTTPLWMWVLQRVSGLLLAPLVALHVYAPGLVSYRIVDPLLLAVVLAHGYSGLRRLSTATRTASLNAIVVIAWCAAVAFFGALIVIASITS